MSRAESLFNVALGIGPSSTHIDNQLSAIVKLEKLANSSDEPWLFHLTSHAFNIVNDVERRDKYDSLFYAYQLGERIAEGIHKQLKLGHDQSTTGLAVGKVSE